MYQAFSSHENVIQLLNVVKATNNIDLYLVFEFMDSDLHVVIKNRLLQPAHHPYIMYQVRGVESRGVASPSHFLCTYISSQIRSPSYYDTSLIRTPH